MESIIKVTYQATNQLYKANQFLREIEQHDIFAADFEAAIKYTPVELESFKQELEQNPTKRHRIELESKLAATALDHPSHTVLTHCQLAINDHEAFVFILDNKKLTDRVLTFLTTTEKRQIWHNASYDFRQIHYRTDKFPKLYEDTQLRAKCILNHTDPQQALTGLKHLAGHRYGNWAISADNFTIEQMYDPQVLQYAATDPCATMWLWNSISNHVETH